MSLCTPANAGIRGPGKYSGVVIFDRWDGCILFSGVYLMYISERVKDQLREYDGQAIELDALEVFQPKNPGDGLIQKLKVLGPAPPSNSPFTFEGISLDAQPRPLRVYVRQLNSRLQMKVTHPLKSTLPKSDSCSCRRRLLESRRHQTGRLRR